MNTSPILSSPSPPVPQTGVKSNKPLGSQPVEAVTAKILSPTINPCSQMTEPNSLQGRVSNPSAEIHDPMNINDQLWKAAYNHDWNLVKSILEGHEIADVNVGPIEGPDRGMTVLGLAVSDHQWGLVEWMLKNNVRLDVNAAPTEGPDRGVTVLWMIAYFQQWKLVKWILKNCSRPNVNAAPIEGFDRGGNVLWMAAAWKQWNLVALMLAKDRRANVLAKALEGPGQGISVLRLTGLSEQRDLLREQLEHLENLFNSGRNVAKMYFEGMEDCELRDILAMREWVNAKAPKMMSFIIRQQMTSTQKKDTLANFVLDKVYYEGKSNPKDSQPLWIAPYLANTLFAITDERSEMLGNVFKEDKLKAVNKMLESFAIELSSVGMPQYIVLTMKNYRKVYDELSIKIRGLPPGEFILVSVGSKIHATLLEIGRSREGTYTVRLFNTGDGLPYHHSSDPTTGKFETCYGFSGVPQKRLLNFSHWETLFKAISENLSMDDIYWELNKMCEAERRDPVGLFQEDLQTAQRSGSCAYLCLLAALRYRCIHNPAFESPAEGLAIYKLIKKQIVHNFALQGLKEIASPSIKYAVELKLRMLGLEEQFAMALANPESRQRELEQMATYLETIQPETAEFCRKCINEPHLSSYSTIRLVIRILGCLINPITPLENLGLGLQLARARHERMQVSIEEFKKEFKAELDSHFAEGAIEKCFKRYDKECITSPLMEQAAETWLRNKVDQVKETKVLRDIYLILAMLNKTPLDEEKIRCARIITGILSRDGDALLKDSDPDVILKLSDTLRDTSMECIRLWSPVLATRVALAIPKKDKQAEVLSEIAKKLTDIGEFDDAIRAANAITDSGKREELLSEISQKKGLKGE